MVKLFPLAALLLACGGYPAPDTTSGWSIDGSAPERTGDVLDLAHARAPCAIPDAEWGGVVTFVGSLDEGGFFTWYPDDVPRLTVEWNELSAVQATALAHEAGHVAWAMCGLDPNDGPDFLAWVDGVNAALPPVS